MASPDSTKVVIEGFAFEDNIIGLSLVKTNGDNAAHFYIQNMVATDQLNHYGLSTFAHIRDPNSGKKDEPLRDQDGYAKFIILCINIHKFNTPQEAHSAVITQCQNLYEV